VKTDGVPGIIEKKVGLMGRIGREINKKNPNFTWNFTGSSTNNYFRKSFELRNVMKVVVSALNFI
jgi:hypothetical protein